MAITTTVIGAYPKPSYIKLPDWFEPKLVDATDTAAPTKNWAKALEAMGPDAEQTLQRGIKQVIGDQVVLGIDIPTDGEVRRENYVHYHCRHLDGFDFTNLTQKVMRNGSYTTSLPTINGRVTLREYFLADEWKIAQSFTDKPVKVTLPGPMTVTDTNADAFYHDDAKLGADVAEALNKEVLALAEAGCQHIQIDEPLFARKPQQALDYGFENLERAFHNCPVHVQRTVHMCCGYPDRIDRDDYLKADPQSYFALSDAIEYSSIDAISIEDAHRNNDLSLLEKFQNTKVIFGVVAIAQSRIESVDEIAHRLELALQHIDADRLLAAPDCGMGFLSREQCRLKLTNLCLGARQVG